MERSAFYGRPLQFFPNWIDFQNPGGAMIRPSAVMIIPFIVP